MSGLLDDPPNPVPVQVALILEGECRDGPQAYTEMQRFLTEFTTFVEQGFPNLRIERAEVGYGEADDDASS